jgi:hypothetical protein
MITKIRDNVSKGNAIAGSVNSVINWLLAKNTESLLGQENITNTSNRFDTNWSHF